jgi:hypothetical protein
MNNIIKNKTGDFTLNEKKLYLLCSLIITQNPIVYYDGNTVDVEDFLVNTYTSVSPMSYTMLTNVSTYFTEGGYKDLQIKDVDIDITLNADQITKSLKIIDEVNKSILSK